MNSSHGEELQNDPTEQKPRELESLVHKGRFPCSKLAPDSAMATPASRKQALASASRAPASLCSAVPPSLLSPSACAPSARLATESASPHAVTLGPAAAWLGLVLGVGLGLGPGFKLR